MSKINFIFFLPFILMNFSLHTNFQTSSVYWEWIGSENWQMAIVIWSKIFKAIFKNCSLTGDNPEEEDVQKFGAHL